MTVGSYGMLFLDQEG
ncbi:hypothetical protein LINPERHAP1_LOCUS158 [Linum perenne]